MGTSKKQDYLVQGETTLVGMKEICTYMRRSEATVLKLVQEYEDFPAKKINGIWESDKTMIDVWRRKQLQGAA